ncbi:MULTISPECIES: ABC transporter substrate-binding protein [Raoultella]|jgi:osmoprotectant transport system substrate-binding protein|uniref:ABC transporter substrate-binding protein n=1 Tax=Raoultella terrigena TaxID=577 RepID=A0A1V2BI28_RAOTE|nr:MULTISPECIES: ABC transporter substrate-binding protein [Raoultella]AJF73813.1 quaternary ammonium transporter [Raoultella ornithinolytica]MCS4273467.1 osmoprotectant transport system substrate-binding protein [Raoultella sp. BIGb0132]MCS4290096.1 osmoprotectant transport system substrate-binding protein [Raoultella terrigena]MEB7598470.1 ABC transporter substrate-binding protein [Raoultella terrigena]MEB8192648.1 ABC transporter substrate-binding protein [Raoultella terrigena]
MHNILAFPFHRRRFRLSLLAVGLLGLSFSSLAESVTIGGANFTESSILANIYASALKKNNIEVSTRLNLGNREIIIPALKSGEIDIVPEYLGALLNYYDGKTLATSQSDVSAELAKVLPADFTLLTPSPATSITAWAVRADTAKKYGLSKLSDLQPIAHQLTIGGPPELAVRALGLPGLKRVYGLEFKAVKSLDMGGPLTRLALNSGKIDVATVISTQGNLAKEDWVVLDDDKHEQPSQNVVPLVRKASLTPTVSKVLNDVSGKLNNATLIELNQQVDLQHKDPAAVAEAWVNDHLANR